MGQKVHPLGFRLGITQKHQNFWCVNPKISVLWLEDANFLRGFIQKTYIRAGITCIKIYRRQLNYSSIIVKIYAVNSMISINTNLVIKKLKEFYKKRHLPDPGILNIKFSVETVKNPKASAVLLAEKLVKALQQREPYRKAMWQIIREATLAGVKGIKVRVSGRLNGVDMARSEELKKGPVPLQALRADIDYSTKTAKTIFGLLGIKIWIFHGKYLSSLTNKKVNV